MFNRKESSAMGSEGADSAVAKIGETAGMVWERLAAASEPVSLTGLAQQLDVPRDLVMQAIGWLAREDKVQIVEQGRTRKISLK